MQEKPDSASFEQALDKTDDAVFLLSKTFNIL
jgi:hypothetical protein